MQKVNIGNKSVGHDEPVFVIAEIGINHNGDINLAKQMIDTAVDAGADAVKFQKRTVDTVYTKDELLAPRESPFGTTNGDQKRGLEFGKKEYSAIDKHCKKRGIMWFASCWDESAVDFIDQFDPPAYKIASASLTDDALLKYTRSKGKPIILSTGMSDELMIERAVKVLGKKDLIVLHCTSTYPGKLEELNLLSIKKLQELYSLPIGYSGHEVGLMPSVCASVLGACVIERHITLDRSMYGSDQSASVEPYGFEKLITYIRAWEKSRGTPEIKIFDSEKPIAKKLRRKWGKWNSEVLTQ